MSDFLLVPANVQAFLVGEVGEEVRHLVAPECLPNPCFAVTINAVHLEYLLCQIDTDALYFHLGFPLIW